MDYLNRLMGQGELVVFLTRRHGSVLLPALLLALALCALIAAATFGAAFTHALLNAKQELEHPTQPPGQATDLTSLLISLKTLRDQHVLSEDEYQAKKAELLARF